MKSSFDQSIALCGAIFAFTALGSSWSVSAAQSDVAMDYSATNNPAGVWSYGWKNNLNGNFNLLTQPWTATSDNGVVHHGWILPTYTQPAVYANQTTNTGTGVGGWTAPPGAVWLLPGLNGRPENFGVIRFTAPSNGNYQINAATAPMYTGGLAGDTDFHVVRNGTELFGRFLGPHETSGFTNVVALNSGDTLDFAIGRGADNNESGSSFRLAASIAPTTNSAPVILTFPRLSNGQFRFLIPSLGANYVVEASSNLISWFVTPITVATNLDRIILTDTNPGTAYRFYRLRSP